MTTPQQNTKVELLVEAIETFANACAQGVVYAETGAGQTDSTQLHVARESARTELVSALKDFLAPSFRVMGHEPNFRVITEREHRAGELSTISRKTVETTR